MATESTFRTTAAPWLVTIQAAADIGDLSPGTAQQEHLAVLRVSGLGHGPEAARIEVRRVDVLVLLAAVDRLAQGREPAVHAHESVTGTAAGSYFAGGPVTFFSGATVYVGRMPGVAGD